MDTPSPFVPLWARYVDDSILIVSPLAECPKCEVQWRLISKPCWFCGGQGKRRWPD